MKFSIHGALCIALCYTSCSLKHEEKEEKFKFLVTSPLKQDTTVTKPYVCLVRAIQHIELRALERGYLQNIFVDEGKFVKKGQIMFQIMPLLYQAELQKAEAEAKFAEIEYLNTKQLADSNVVSKNELALAKAKLDKARAELSLAQVHLSFTQIKAPFDGIMDRFQVRLGSLVDEGDLLTTLSDNSEMWVYFNVPEAEYLNYKTNLKKDSLMRVQLQMANSEIFEYSGIVKTIEADFNNETGNIVRNSTGFSDLVSKLMKEGIPSQLLQNRPDVRGAEWNLAAAKLDVTVAKANFYPQLNISAALGVQAYNFSLIGQPESVLYSIGGGLAQPLINRNAIKAVFFSANARQVQAVYSYEQTVLRAYIEVANQLANINNMQNSYELRKRQVEALTESIDISTRLFRFARADYMEVLLTQRDALESKFEWIETKKQQMTAMVNLYQALGGGWN
ncbi:MAG: efflux RND transporter periplasmic adaptor subunit [Cytophagales bacterium]